MGLGALAAPLFVDWAKRQWIDALSEIPGIPTKFSQLLAAHLQIDPQLACPEPVAVDVVLGWIRQRSPKLWEEIEEISELGFTASLGQVHRVKLKRPISLRGWRSESTPQRKMRSSRPFSQVEEREVSIVAVKLQYPGLKERLPEQLSNLIRILERSPLAKRGLDTLSYRLEMTQWIESELDYLREAEAQNLFMERADGWVKVPAVYLPWSTRYCLVQEWIEVDSLKSRSDAPLNQRCLISSRFTHWWLHSLFVEGLLHTDLHPDNLGVEKDSDDVVLFDFGSTLKLTPEERTALRNLVRRSLQEELTESQVLSDLLVLGFSESRLAPIRGQLPKLIAAFTRFLREKAFDAREWSFSEKVNEILGEEKGWFRSAGSPRFLLVMRSLSGWLNALRIINGTVPLSEILEGLGFQISKGCEQDKIPSIRSESSKVASVLEAFRLRVQLIEGDKVKVDLEFPGQRALALEELLPESVLTQLQNQGVSLAAMQESLIKELTLESSPQVTRELFHQVLDHRVIRVWLSQSREAPDS